MKRTLGRPTYAFEARQYVVSVCVTGVSTSGVCVCVWAGTRCRWILNVWLVKAMYSTYSSLINDYQPCDTFTENGSSQRTRLNVLTEEASVCACLGIDHMALTRVESGANDRRGWRLHPTSHVIGLKFCCCSRLIQGFPTEHLMGVNSQSVTSTWGCGGSWAWGCFSSQQSPPPSSLIKSHPQLDGVLDEVLSHFGRGFRLQYPEFTPPGLSLC